MDLSAETDFYSFSWPTMSHLNVGSDHFRDDHSFPNLRNLLQIVPPNFHIPAIMPRDRVPSEIMVAIALQRTQSYAFCVVCKRASFNGCASPYTIDPLNGHKIEDFLHHVETKYVPFLAAEDVNGLLDSTRHRKKATLRDIAFY